MFKVGFNNHKISGIHFRIEIFIIKKKADYFIKHTVLM